MPFFHCSPGMAKFQSPSDCAWYPRIYPTWIIDQSLGNISWVINQNVYVNEGLRLSTITHYSQCDYSPDSLTFHLMWMQSWKSSKDSLCVEQLDCLRLQTPQRIRVKSSHWFKLRCSCVLISFQRVMKQKCSDGSHIWVAWELNCFGYVSIQMGPGSQDGSTQFSPSSLGVPQDFPKPETRIPGLPDSQVLFSCWPFLHIHLESDYLFLPFSGPSNSSFKSISNVGVQVRNSI